MENFSEAFYKPDGLYEAGMLDHIFRGMIKTHTQSEDLHVNEEMTNKMFMDSKFGFGLDLVAQVIQQGRDHGLPGSYNKYMIRGRPFFEILTPPSPLSPILLSILMV